MNGAPRSSASVLADQAGANCSKVRRPSRMAEEPPMIAPIASPIFGSNGKSKLHAGFSMTPSRVMNSWTALVPIAASSPEPAAR
jgi:hypothetical protein